MKSKILKISAIFILFASTSFTTACWQTSDSNQNATPTPATTPETTRGCPAGTKACGDACIPKKQPCGGN